jgi:hypothetical protein
MATLGANSASPVTDTPPALAGAPKLNWQQATIVGIASDTPRVKSFLFTTPAPLAFRAGQHVDVRLTAPDGYQAERSYSIASAPERTDGIELAIERLDDGEVSPFFHEVAEIGDAIELRGPIGGHFVWSVEDGGPLLLLGGGSGVVPLMSMLRHRAARGSMSRRCCCSRRGPGRMSSSATSSSPCTTRTTASTSRSRSPATSLVGQRISVAVSIALWSPSS